MAAVIFELIGSTLSAFNQAVVFAGALFCWAVGGLLVGNAIYWRLHAVRVQGQVIGVRRNGNCLNAVYRYDSPAGETLEATSLEGSSSSRGKETGRQVPLWVIPEKPNEAQEADNHLFSIVGMVFLGFGGALFSVGATAWPITPMTWVVGGLLAAHLLWKLRSLFLPRDATLSRAGWRALPDLLRTVRPADAAPAEVMAPVQRVEELSGPPGSNRESQMRARAQLVRLAPLLLLTGVGVIALGVYTSHTLLELEGSGLRTSGRVISLSASSSSNGGTTYHPIVSYCDSAGRTIVFRDATGTNPPTHHVGDRVTVLYRPGDPARAIIDRGVWNWLPEVVLYLLGGALVAGGLAAWRARTAMAEPAAND